MNRPFFPLILALSVPFSLGACAEKVITSSGTPPPPARGTHAEVDAGTKQAVEYTENDFVESDRSRDPFHAYASLMQVGPKAPTNQRQVKLGDYSVDELRLAAIIMARDKERAMFIDPNGRGSVVYKGDFICRPDSVRLGSNGPEYQLNWRVDRIREGDVVLIREDPAQPSVPPATRVVPLHPEANSKHAEL